MTKEGSTKTVNFMTSWVLMLWRGHINHDCEYVLSPSLSIYFALIVIMLKDNNAASLYHCWFLLSFWLYDGAVDKQIRAPQCKVSDSLLRWPWRPLGLLFIAYDLFKTFWDLIEFLWCFNIFGNVLVYTLFESQR